MLRIGDLSSTGSAEIRVTLLQPSTVRCPRQPSTIKCNAIQYNTIRDFRAKVGT